MDEMDEYRDRIERRQNGRRQKTDRRQQMKPPEPKFFDPFFVIDMVIFAAIAVAYYFANKN